jgi:carboxypeptidase C (cathepsin A)
MTTRIAGLAASALLLGPASSGRAQTAPAVPEEPGALAEVSSSRKGRLSIDGQAVDYTATVGEILLRDEQGKPKAKMTYVAYTRDGVAEPHLRPVTFSFNGGPGSAAVWVHLGAFGPKRARLDDEAMPAGPPPGRLVDNEFSVLDVTDLVFIDPVGTGFSRPAPGEDPKQFFGYTPDVRWVGEFIRSWLGRNDRWASPKIIAGESYGTTRSAGLAAYLQDHYAAPVNGVVLISSVLNWQTKVFNVGNDLPYPLILPSYTAAAWYHGKLPERLRGDLPAALKEAEEFALGDYASALLQGDRLPAAERKRIARRLAELTGLSETYVEQADLRIEIFRFAKQLLRGEGRTIGRLDSRYVGRDLDSAGERFEYDPAASVFDAHFVSLLKDYLGRGLGYRNDRPFLHSNPEVRPWNYHEADRTEGYNTNAYANYAETLRAAMAENPYLKVLVASGRYDLATPYFATDYTVDHMQLDDRARANLRVAYYDAGHMMYVRKADHRKLRQDFVTFLREAVGAP